jgi:hypothetical protein
MGNAKTHAKFANRLDQGSTTGVLVIDSNQSHGTIFERVNVGYSWGVGGWCGVWRRKKDPVNDRVLEQNYFLDSFFSFLASRFSFKVFAGAFLVCFSTWRSLAMFIS